jgi:arsenate reductase (thioredoxin)
MYAAGIRLWSRAQFLFLLVVVLPALYAQTQESKHPEVVFVCEHGAAKSIIASAEFNKLAEQRGLLHRAIARGTNPDATFSTAVISGLRKHGLAEPKGRPQMVTATDLNKAKRVVTLGCKLPDLPGQSMKAMAWDDVSSPSQDYDTARGEIVRHIKALVDELAREQDGTK